VAFVLALSFLRNAHGAIQSSLYVVYLADIGWSGTLIGMFVGLAEFFGVFGSMMAAAAERRVPADRLMLVCIVVSLSAIAITPLIGGLLVALIAASAARGTAQGMSQPLMYSMLSRAAPSARHGTSVGLRNAVVRFASILTPAAMGIVAEAWGVEASFYAVGAGLLFATAILAVAARGQKSEVRRQT
jgi:MFS-type transporter involved in bile tolerance (Atg22 family)